MSISIVSRVHERTETRYGSIYDVTEDEEECPDYDAVVKRRRVLFFLLPAAPADSPMFSNSNATTSSSLPYSPRSSFDDPSPITPSRPSAQRRPRPLPRHERYIYTYCLKTPQGTPIQFIISVEPESGKPTHGKCTFRLSVKANGIERAVGEPTTRTLKVDPRTLDFVVFIFPGKQGPPTGCMWCLRVWLRVGDTDHRLFGEDELWIGKDPDFSAIAEASFARQKTSDNPNNEQIYHAYVGRALVTFIIRWKHIIHRFYRYSLEYEAGGVGDVLFDDVVLKIDNDPRSISFLIFSTPSNSIPAGAAHKLRVWIRSLVPLTNPELNPGYGLPFGDSYIYQRIWKNDSFKVGGRLDFETLGSKMVKAFAAGAVETVVTQGPSDGSRTGGGGAAGPKRKDSMRKEGFE